MNLLWMTIGQLVTIGVKTTGRVMIGVKTTGWLTIGVKTTGRVMIGVKTTGQVMIGAKMTRLVAMDSETLTNVTMHKVHRKTTLTNGIKQTNLRKKKKLSRLCKKKINCCLAKQNKMKN